LRAGYMVLIIAVQIAMLAVARQAPFSLLRFAVVPFALLLESKTDFETMATDFVKRGVKAKAPAAIVGKSGVRHEFAFAVVPESGKPRVVIDTELSVKDVDEMKVLKFYVKVYDVGPEKAVLCVSPRLGERASALAKEYRIQVLEDETPRKLIPKAAKFVSEFSNSK